MSVFDQQVAAMRRFSRFYTARIGVLDDGCLQTPFSLGEGRVLYELAQRGRATAEELVGDLGIDAGCLNRILHAFEAKGLVSRAPSPADAQEVQVRITDAGRDAFAPLNAQAREAMGAMLRGLSGPDQGRVVEAMRIIETLLGARPEEPRYQLRTHRPGDMGWVVRAHGSVYAREYGFDQSFEALVAEIAAKFINNFDPAGERCWIAEMDGKPIGSVFLVRHSATVAQLRLLLVDPQARGLGVGKELVAECVRFARACGYQRVTLWTQSILIAARRVYAQAGFQLVAAEDASGFGKEPVSDETWELELT
ncbi:bifunctional helix-turn-helix transcriptional regulator/GNAT family N-acetyltransferase [Desertibaculum subflavum]|uniref:bifunctional helix-turn-helix transcriptional regulator/GNAT family N-acetyltransferase n=1 Tax=Desertibaculum subflavum TaxID=2268458 RepID=UPI000E665C7B